MTAWKTNPNVIYQHHSAVTQIGYSLNSFFSYFVQRKSRTIIYTRTNKKRIICNNTIFSCVLIVNRTVTDAWASSQAQKGVYLISLAHKVLQKLSKWLFAFVSLRIPCVQMPVCLCMGACVDHWYDYVYIAPKRCKGDEKNRNHCLSVWCIQCLIY